MDFAEFSGIFNFDVMAQSVRIPYLDYSIQMSIGEHFEFL